MNQCLYVMSVPSGRHKVGIARDPAGRRRELQVGCPEPVRLVLAADVEQDGVSARTMERSIHDLLAEYRIGGEWFECPLDLVERACRVVWRRRQRMPLGPCSVKRTGRKSSCVTQVSPSVYTNDEDGPGTDPGAGVGQAGRRCVPIISPSEAVANAASGGSPVDIPPAGLALVAPAGLSKAERTRHRAYQRKWRAANRDRYNEYQRAYMRRRRAGNG